MTQPNPTTCRHALSACIEPPDVEGWMRESCGSCGQILRWTLWPHHHRALAACSDGATFCAGCGEEIAAADLVANEDSGETWHRQCRHVRQSQPVWSAWGGLA